MSETIQERLLQEFNKCFSRSYLEKNSYFVFRLTDNLQIKLSDVCENFNVKNITTDVNQISLALKNCDLVRILEDQQTIVLNIKQKQNVIIADNPSHPRDFNEFLNFITNFTTSKEEITVTQEEQSNNSVVITVQQEEKAPTLYEEITQLQFKGQNISAHFRNENIADSLRESVNEHKRKKAGTVTTEQINNSYMQQQMQLSQQGASQYSQEELQRMQQAYEEQVAFQNFFAQQQAMFQASNQNFTHVYQQKDFSDLYIRRYQNNNNNDDKSKNQRAKKNQNKNQKISAYDMQYQQIAYQQQMMAYQQLYYQQMGYVQGNNNQNDNNNNNRKPRFNQNGGNNLRNNSQKRNNSRNRRKSPQNDNRGKRQNNHRNNNKNTSKNNKTERKSSESVEQNQVRKNRPRLESQDFPVLKEVNDKGEKQQVVYLQKAQKPTVKPMATPYKENRTKITKKYTNFEIMTSFSTWQQSQNINEQLAKFQNNENVPIITDKPIVKLEIQQPYRKNSSAVTPLLKPLPMGTFRKRSANFNNHYSSVSPNKRQQSRKFSSQK